MEESPFDSYDDVIISKCWLTPRMFRLHSAGCPAFVEFAHIKLHHLWLCDMHPSL